MEDNYTNEVKQFIHYLNQKGLPFTFDNFKDYANQLYRDSAVKANTYNKKIAGIKRRIRDIFAGECDVTKIYYLNQCLNSIKIKRIADPFVGEDKIITRKEYEILLSELPMDLALMTEMGFECATRISELLTLTFHTIDPRHKLVHCRIQGKKKKQRIVKIQQDLFQRILDHFHEGTFQKPEVYLFHNNQKPLERTNITNRLKQISKRVLNRNVHFHTLRHSRATELVSTLAVGTVEKGESKIKAIATYLGHTDVSTLLNLYVHQSLTDDDLYPKMA